MERTHRRGWDAVAAVAARTEGWVGHRDLGESRRLEEVRLEADPRCLEPKLGRSCCGVLGEGSATTPSWLDLSSLSPPHTFTRKSVPRRFLQERVKPPAARVGPGADLPPTSSPLLPPWSSPTSPPLPLLVSACGTPDLLSAQTSLSPTYRCYQLAIMKRNIFESTSPPPSPCPPSNPAPKTSVATPSPSPPSRA